MRFDLQTVGILRTPQGNHTLERDYSTHCFAMPILRTVRETDLPDPVFRVHT